MIEVRQGQVFKPGATAALLSGLEQVGQQADGVLYIGYPVMGTPDGPFTVDALLVSPQLGVIAFDLIDGRDVRNIEERQDGVFSILTAKLLQGNRRLSRKKRLAFNPKVVTLAPSFRAQGEESDEYEVLTSPGEVADWLLATGEPLDEYDAVLSTVQSVSSIRRGRVKRDVKRAASRGARLQQLEDSIATLDAQQSDAVIQTYDGVQRIRGLAGSGKTIVLALKVAYLYTQNPEWVIAVTFNTRSLKAQFQRLITGFIYDQASEEPDWSRIKILHAWGSAGTGNEGIYFTYCLSAGIPYLDLSGARQRFQSGKEFSGVCELALASSQKQVPLFDVLLVDEAQDFTPSFLRLCYRLTKQPHRIVYAYDELQNLSRGEMPPPEELFGAGADGKPLVKFADDPEAAKRQDIILRKCYRNSRPVLTTAHALGFGLYRGSKGLVQIFDNPDLWTDIGYEVVAGSLEGGEDVVLARTDATSPRFLEEHSPVDDLISFHEFASDADQATWVAGEILRNIREDELRPEDILVIHPDPLTARKRVGGLRGMLMAEGVNSIIAGVTHAPDVFEYENAVTFTGIYRAKGNEAGMVYIINSQFCANDWDAAWARNILFTAITRSKAWVRVCGIGSAMGSLAHEFDRVKANDFRLAFRYPSEADRAKLKVINRDLTPAERVRRSKSRTDLKRIVRDIKAGRLRKEDVEELMEQLLSKE